MKAIPQHLRVPWTVPQAIGTFVIAWIGLPLVVVAIVEALAPVLPAAKEFIDALKAGSVEANFGLDLVNAVAALGLVAMYLRKYDVGWDAVGWRKFSFWKTLAYFGSAFIGFLVLAALALELVKLIDPGFNSNQPQSNEFTGSVSTHRSLTLIALVVIPPIIEETVFRGFIFPAISKKWGTIGGAIASSALFGLAHLQANVSIYTFVLGLVLCFLYVKLKSIFPGMAVHMLNNFLAYYALASK